MSRREKKRASCGHRLAILAVMLGAAIPLGLMQVEHSDYSYANDVERAFYPNSDIIKTVRGKGILPEHMTVYAQNNAPTSRNYIVEAPFRN